MWNMMNLSLLHYLRKLKSLRQKKDLSKPQKEASVEPITETSFDDDIEVEEPLVSTPPTQQDNSIVTETYSETPALTEKERRKAERQAKREARRREKAQKNN